MATTFTLNYSGQEINNRLARVDDCLAKTVDGMEFIQSSAGLGIKDYGTISIRPATNSSSASSIFIENATGASSDKVYLLSNGIRYTISAGAVWTTITYANIETKSHATATYLVKTAEDVTYTQSSNGLAIGSYGDITIRPATSAGQNSYIFIENYTDASNRAYFRSDGIRYSTDAGVNWALLTYPDIATKTEVSAKQDTLISGTNIATINGQTLLNGGNIQVAADVESIPNSEIEALFNPLTLISFTVESTTYQAESGMTWTAWCDSTYNTNRFKVSASSVYTADSQYVIARGLFFVNASDAILADTAYNYMTNGGGGTND